MEARRSAAIRLQARRVAAGALIATAAVALSSCGSDDDEDSKTTGASGTQRPSEGFDPPAHLETVTFDLQGSDRAKTYGVEIDLSSGDQAIYGGTFRSVEAREARFAPDNSPSGPQTVYFDCIPDDDGGCEAEATLEVGYDDKLTGTLRMKGDDTTPAEMGATIGKTRTPLKLGDFTLP